VKISALRPLRHRDFALLWSASLVSNIGTWIQTIAVGSILATDTRKAATLGWAAAAAFLPMAILAPLGGLISDRVHRKLFLIGTLTFDTALATTLAVLLANGQRSPLVLSTILFFEGASAALSLPNRQALMPELLPPEDLLPAVALGSASWNGGRVAGPLLAALIIPTWGATWAVILNAASFAAMVFAAIFIRIPRRRVTELGDNLVTRLRSGVRAIRATPAGRHALLRIALLGATAGPFIGLIPIVAENVFHGGPRVTSIFVTAQGLGAVIGVLGGASLVERIGRWATLQGAMAVAGVSLILYSQANAVAVAAIMLVFVGGAYFIVMSGSQAMVQGATEAQYRARAISLFSVSLSLSYTIAVVLNGLLADAFGLRVITFVQGALCLLVVATLQLRKQKPDSFVTSTTGVR
jgi:MFS family permease